MAPGYRNNPNTRRGARAAHPEHDDFEGLPVRQWVKKPVFIVPPPELEETKKKDRWAEELPHGMPPNSELLPPHSYNLLRAARSGKMHKRPAPVEDDDADADLLPGDKLEKKPAPETSGFSVWNWVRVPRNEEGPTVSHLAKRYKNTITLPSKAVGTQHTGPTITKATVERLDAAGNPYTQEVTLTAGQAVDGKIISERVIAAPDQSGQQTPAAATPIRRKPPIPQKKKHRGRGRGRGRGRMVPLTPSTRPVPQDVAGLDRSSLVKNESIGPDGVKIENKDEKTGQDVEMPDLSAVDDDEGDEGEGEGEGEGDDGDDDEADEGGTPAEHQDQDMDDAPALPTLSSVADATFTPTPDVVPEAGSSLAPPAAAALNPDIARLEGSPLKNVMLRSPTEATFQIHPMATSAVADLPEAASGQGTGLQPSPMDSQLQLPSASDVIEETPVEDPDPQVSPVPEEAVVAIAESAEEATETVAEETSCAVATTSIQEPEEGSNPDVDPQPSEDVFEAALVVAATPVPTSEDPKAVEIPEAGDAPSQPQATLPDSTTSAEEPPAPAAISVLAPLDVAPATQAMTEDGTDDGSDILGALGARLDAEEDVPPPTSAPTIPTSQGPTEPPSQAEEAPVQETNNGEN